jgi:alpha-mannosidase
VWNFIEETLMSFTEDLDARLSRLNASTGATSKWLERFRAEVDFASRLAQANPNQRSDWERLILEATTLAASSDSVESAVKEAEGLLAPIGRVAKRYTIHCVGHAHIDMNWIWNWAETVATTNDTFSTVDRLMEAYPTFRFSQSQTSVYQLTKDYLPELYEAVKRRVAEGKWEVTATQWVEGDKNMASGETLCRHLLYTKRFFRDEFGLPFDAVTIDFEPDAFGHAHTIPGILIRGGVKRYYFCRAGHGPQLFWWQGKDGSRVLAFDDSKQWYQGPLTHEIARHVIEFEQTTGLRDYLYVYGVGDHGGGPTKRDLNAALEMDTWPVFPNVKMSTTDAFFSIAEKEAKDLPVVDREMNYVFEGCYTSQSNIKRANRLSENALIEAEIAACVGAGLVGLPYPSEALLAGWRSAMFNQFHDILPGSGCHATYEYSQGLFQEILAQTTMVKTRAYRAIASRVNTLASAPNGVGSQEPGPNLGSGPGDVATPGSVSRWSAGGATSDSYVVFNSSPWKRHEVVVARLWDRETPNHELVITDDAGNRCAAQVLERRPHWFYRYVDVAFPVEVDGIGYRSYTISRSVTPATGSGCFGDGRGVMENDYLKVVLDPSTGTVAHLIDKRTGVDLVPPDRPFGDLEYVLEAPHGMSSWVLGQVVKTTPLRELGATLECPQNGPYLAVTRVNYKLNDSRFTLAVSLSAGSPRLDFTLDMDWLERGSPEIGVPGIKVAFPLNVADGTATFECPNGSVVRPTEKSALTGYTYKWSPRERIALGVDEVPGQKWCDLTGTQSGVAERVGATVLNADKYGQSIFGNTIRLDLVRSSYEPDPLPELGHHTVRFAVQPHVGAWTPSAATRAGYDFNLPLNVVSATQQTGDLPSRGGLVEILSPNVMLSGLKKAEDSDGLVLRLYEMEGTATEAKVHLDGRLVPPNASAVETDVLEQPLASNTASLSDGVLRVTVPPFGMATVLSG